MWLLVAFVLGLIVAVVVLRRVAAWLGRWRGFAGRRAERKARRLLESAGYDIVDAHPKTDAVVIVDGRRVAIPILADFLVTRGSQRFAVEVKSGKERHVTSGATRRQLLEYACAYDVDAVLLVDAVDRRILEVRFPYAGKYGS